jgi:hypothetical protein
MRTDSCFHVSLFSGFQQPELSTPINTQRFEPGDQVLKNFAVLHNILAAAFPFRRICDWSRCQASVLFTRRRQMRFLTEKRMTGAADTIIGLLPSYCYLITGALSLRLSLDYCRLDAFALCFPNRQETPPCCYSYKSRLLASWIEISDQSMELPLFHITAVAEAAAR